MSPNRRFIARASAFSAALLLAACGSDGDGADPDTGVVPDVAEDASADVEGDGSGDTTSDPCPAGAEIRIDPTHVSLDLESPTVEIGINNGGTEPACFAIPAWRVEPENADLVVSGTPPNVLQPGETFTLTVTMGEEARGRRLGYVVFQSTNGGDARLQLDMQGGQLLHTDVDGPEDLAPGEAFVFFHAPWGAQEIFVTRDAGFIRNDENGATLDFRAEGFDLELGMATLIPGMPVTSANLEWEVSREEEFEFDFEGPRLEFQEGRDGRLTGSLINAPVALQISGSELAVWELHFNRLPCLDCEVCDNGSDDDGDLEIDCLDEDCRWDVACGDYYEQDCTDGIDNDGDSLMDCDDEDCFGEFGCIETDCEDGFDNDNDGLVDCDDPGEFSALECASHPTCREVDCDDGVDNDLDGYTDCEDPGCHMGGVADGCEETECDDGIDNNGNGLVDCLDWLSCAGDPACAPADSCPMHDMGSAIFAPGNGNGGQTLIAGHPSGQELDSSCGPPDLPEMTFRWVAPADGDYVFRAWVGPDAQTHYVIRGGCDGEEVACQVHEYPVIGFFAGTLVEDVVEGEEYILVVESAAEQRVEATMTPACSTDDECPFGNTCRIIEYAAFFDMDPPDACAAIGCFTTCPEGTRCAGEYSTCVPFEE